MTETGEVPPPRRARFSPAIRALLCRLAAVYLVVALVSFLLLGSCCATNRMWRAVDVAPTRFVDASLPDTGILHAAVEYEDGEVWLLTADIGAEPRDWRSTEATRVEPLRGELPESGRMVVPEGLGFLGTEIRAGYVRSVDATATETHMVTLDGSGQVIVVTCPTPVDWSRPGAYLAVLATPVTLAVDLLTAPIHLAWTLATVGGHGDPWLPWCGDG